MKILFPSTTSDECKKQDGDNLNCGTKVSGLKNKMEQEWKKQTKHVLEMPAATLVVSQHPTSKTSWQWDAMAPDEEEIEMMWITRAVYDDAESAKDAAVYWYNTGSLI